MTRTVVVDYGIVNLKNIARGLEYVGGKVVTSVDPDRVLKADRVILPGVGAFGNAMKQLELYNLKNTILEYAKLNKPLLGICIGMQLLLTESYEFGFHEGLNLIKGKVIKIPNKKNKEIKIPHIGWNELYPNNDKKEWKNKILNNSLIGKSFYFIHSFVCLTKNPSSTIAVCNYLGISIPAIISVGNIFGCQFHPEKSADNGLTVLRNFCEI